MTLSKPIHSLKIKVIYHADWQFRTKSSGFIKGGLKIKACEIE